MDLMVECPRHDRKLNWNHKIVDNQYCDEDDECTVMKDLLTTAIWLQKNVIMNGNPTTSCIITHSRSNAVEFVEPLFQSSCAMGHCEGI